MADNGRIQHGDLLLLKENADTIPAELLAVLQEKTLVNALPCVFLLAIAFCSERSNEESVGSTWNIDISVLLNKSE